MCGKYENINYNYDSGSGPGQQLHSQSSPGDLAVVEGQKNGKFSQNSKFGQNGKLGHSCVRVTKGRLYDSRCHRIFGFPCFWHPHSKYPRISGTPMLIILRIFGTPLG